MSGASTGDHVDHDRLDADAFLRTMGERRSISRLGPPGPTDRQLDAILGAATTVPDHGSLRPWRFFVVTGDQRVRFGRALRAAGVEHLDAPAEAALAKLESKALVAPTMIVLVCAPTAGKVALWEQEASAASAGYAMVLAAHVLGLGAIWKSASVRTGEALRALFDLTEHDRLMGWVNLGTPVVSARERRNPPRIADLARRLTDDGTVPWEPFAT